jgi:hypothetical protein
MSPPMMAPKGMAAVERSREKLSTLPISGVGIRSWRTVVLRMIQAVSHAATIPMLNPGTHHQGNTTIEARPSSPHNSSTG